MLILYLPSTRGVAWVGLVESGGAKRPFDAESASIAHTGQIGGCSTLLGRCSLCSVEKKSDLT
jgi:hypothetical protein